MLREVLEWGNQETLVWKKRIQILSYFLCYTATVAGCKIVGFQNGALNETKFNNPYGIVLNPNDNNLYVSDNNNHCVRMINAQGIIIIALTVD